MTRNIKATHFFFCFHPKFDTGTWTIASAFAALIIFTSVFVITIAYAVPTCACPNFYAHLTILPAVPKAVYVGAILYFALLMFASVLAIYGTFKAQHQKLPLYIILLVITEISVFVGSIFVFKFLSKFEEYLLFDNDTYIDLARFVMKEEIFAKLENIITNLSFLVREFLGLSLGEALNVDKLLDAALKEEVIVILGGMKQLMKVSVSILLTGFNAFLIAAVLTASSHYYRLRNGRSRRYTGVPDMVIHKAVLSDSIKSAPSVTSSDISAIPMSRYPRSRSPKTHDSTARNSRRIYSEVSRNGSGKYRKGEVRSYAKDFRRPYSGVNGSLPSSKGELL